MNEYASVDSVQNVQAVFPEWHRMEQVDVMSNDELDELPFGAIELDASGMILRYNAAETAISGMASSEVVGRNFFTEIAPCTNVITFAGRFREGIAREDLNHVFPYLFAFDPPLEVWIRLYYSRNSRSSWVFVVRREESEAAAATSNKD